jgi:hypothetical protein
MVDLFMKKESMLHLTSGNISNNRIKLFSLTLCYLSHGNCHWILSVEIYIIRKTDLLCTLQSTKGVRSTHICFPFPARRYLIETLKTNDHINVRLSFDLLMRLTTFLTFCLKISLAERAAGGV